MTTPAVVIGPVDTCIQYIGAWHSWGVMLSSGSVLVIVVVVVVVPTGYSSPYFLSMVGCIVDLVYMSGVVQPVVVLDFCPHPGLVTTAQVTLLCLALLASNHGAPVICLASLGYQPCCLAPTRHRAERIELC